MGILSSPEKSEALRSNLLSSVQSGCHTGKLPFGYVKASPNYQVALIDEEEAPTVREAFRLALVGRTVSEIALLMRRGGFAGRNGAPLARSSVHAMLANPFYAGMVRLNGETYPGRHEPLVSAVDFGVVQAGLLGRRSVPVPMRLASNTISKSH